MKDEIKELEPLLGMFEMLKDAKDGSIELSKRKTDLLLDYITNLQDTLKDREEYCYGLETQLTNLQEKVGQYENPDDMTLFYMWLDEKAKDKIKQLQEENNSYLKRLEEAYEREDTYKSRIYKAIEYIKENYETELSVDSYYKFKDLCEFDDIINILKGEDKDD